MYFVKERVDKICNDLQRLSVVKSQPIISWKIKEGFFLTPDEAERSSHPWSSFHSASDYWEGNDRHYWFKTSFSVPEDFAGESLWISLSTQKNYWDAVNPQFLVFVNGEIVQGADVNHKEVKITGCAKAGDEYTVELQAYTGRDTDIHEGSTKKLELSGSLIAVEEDVLRLYYNLSIPNQIIGWIDSQSCERIKLSRLLEQTVNLIDLRKPYSDEFFASVKAANTFIETELYEKLTGNSQVTATCIGHTHIDVAWWWTVEQTKEKVVRSFATVLKLMEEYPEYKFMSSQPQLYKYVKTRYPDLYNKIAQRIREGRWEAEGGMWLEADCNVTSGESLVRQLLHGKSFFRDEFHVDSRILWLPDVFGYSAALPQIMKKSGIDYFMTTKIAWNQFDKHPYDTFWWKGIDGSEVFTHLITTQSPDQPRDSFFTTYNGSLDSVSVIRAWERYQQKDFNNDVLISYGHGDGGGGPTRQMIEAGKRLSKGLPGAPKVRLETSKKYFDELYDRLHQDPKLPKWAGELYLEYHRGTYTSMSRNKKANRKCELLWQDAEFFSVWAEKYGCEYPKEQILRSWENILLNQFHDILPGSSIKDVYDTTKIEYEKLLKEADELINNQLHAITENIAADPGDVAVFNSLSFDRDDLVILDTAAPGYADTEGGEAMTQRTHDNKLLMLASAVPSKGCKIYKPVSEPTAFLSNPFMIQEKSIENDIYRITFDDHFHIVSFFDKEENREVLKDGSKGNVLIAYEDKPMNYDNWDIDIYYTEKSWVVDDVQSAAWVEHGPVRSVLAIRRRFVDSVIEQKIYFYAHTKRIDFDTYVDWKQHQVLLKVEFPVDINANEATYDIQFGNITRPTHTNTSWDMAKFEVCAHKWADLSEDGYGVSLMNDCKYGYSIHEGSMKLTLLKSGILPNPVADQEEHRFVYSLYPHKGGWKEAQTARNAYMINVPLYSCRKKGSGGQGVAGSFLGTQADHVMIETVKKAENGQGTIIRMYEYKNRRSEVRIHWQRSVTKVSECNLMEDDIVDIPCQQQQFSFTIHPYEIKTFRIIE